MLLSNKAGATHLIGQAAPLGKLVICPTTPTPARTVGQICNLPYNTDPPRIVGQIGNLPYNTHPLTHR
ncbi:MAG: hypothetical protein HZB77_01385 [Chloroflexi bacterium]|nr:hypothetical protein [Chloroflexota bacterium]